MHSWWESYLVSYWIELALVDIIERGSFIKLDLGSVLEQDHGQAVVNGGKTQQHKDEGRTEVGSASKFADDPSPIIAISSRMICMTFEHNLQLVTAQSQEDACSKLIIFFRWKEFLSDFGLCREASCRQMNDLRCLTSTRSRWRGLEDFYVFCKHSTAGEVAGSRWQGLDGGCGKFWELVATGCILNRGSNWLLWKMSFRLVLQVALLLLVQVQLLGHGNARNKSRQKIQSRWTCWVYIIYYMYRYYNSRRNHNISLHRAPQV